MSESAPTATSPEENTPAEEQEFMPLDVTTDTPENQHYSPTGDMVIRAALRVNGLLERNNKARHDAAEWTKSTVEEAKERTKSVFMRIGRATRQVAKTAFVDAPMAGLGMAMMAGEAVSNKAVEIHSDVTESIDRKVEDGKDMLADRRDGIRIGLARTALFMNEPTYGFSRWRQGRAERKAEKALSKLDRADAKRAEVENNRSLVLQFAEQAKQNQANRATARELRRAA
jgi:hypothetical protein